MTGGRPFDVPLLGPGSQLDPRQQAIVAALQRAERAGAAQVPSDAPLDPGRRRRVELTRAELWAQPTVIGATLEAESAAIREAGRSLAARRLDRLYVVGCGDSLAAAVAVRPLFERLLHVPCEALQALDHAHYLHGNTDARTAIIGISSSGQTPSTVGALLRARSGEALTIGLSNSPGSPLLDEAELPLRVHATRQGWPTQTTTGAMAVLCRLAVEAAPGAGSDTRAVSEQLARLPELMERTLTQFDAPMAELAGSLVQKSLHLFAGAGGSWGTAQLGAAKVRECTPTHAFAIHLEEFHHYNSQKIGDPLFVVVPDGPSMPRALDTVEAGKAWGGLVYVLSGACDPAFERLADQVFTLPAISDLLSPLVYVIPLQRFAYHLGLAQFARAETHA